jgi:ech hydrogenase subunit D
MTEKETQSIIEIGIERLLPEVDALRSAGWRIIQILCISSPEGNELSYSFGLGLEMRSLRFRVLAASAAEGSVPSITALYPAAFLYENEIRDLFGVNIERIAGDWDGKVYDVAGAPGGGKPFSKVAVRAISSEEAVR